VLQVFLQRIVIENSTEMIEKGIVNPDILSFTPETIKAATVSGGAQTRPHRGA